MGRNLVLGHYLDQVGNHAVHGFAEQQLTLRGKPYRQGSLEWHPSVPVDQTDSPIKIVSGSLCLVGGNDQRVNPRPIRNIVQGPQTKPLQAIHQSAQRRRCLA